MALEVLSEAEAAQMARMAPRHLARLRLAGKGPTYTKVGRSPRYLITDVEYWLKANRIVAVYPCEIIEKGDQP